MLWTADSVGGNTDHREREGQAHTARTNIVHGHRQEQLSVNGSVAPSSQAPSTGATLGMLFRCVFYSLYLSDARAYCMVTDVAGNKISSNRHDQDVHSKARIEHRWALATRPAARPWCPPP